MCYSYDDAKRATVLAMRGLDLADAPHVFEGFHLSRADRAHSTQEERVVTVGMLDGDVVLVVWTPRGDGRRIITMWKANDKERENYHRQRDRPR